MKKLIRLPTAAAAAADFGAAVTASAGSAQKQLYCTAGNSTVS